MKGQELIDLLKPYAEQEVEFLPIEHSTKVEVWANEGEDLITTIDAVNNYAL